ncbi:MAG: hypothetical protein QOE68_118, partial [Thermoanaerobaculia bacterium]|nr:hypothetical protein [Thermoanaerobaculia bacterium]
MGGFVGDRGSIIPGSPRYSSGQRYLVFLRRTADGWATYGFGLGKFEFNDNGYGRPTLARAHIIEGIFGWDEATNSPHVERTRDADGFLRFVRVLVANPTAPAREQYFAFGGETVHTLSFSVRPEVSAPGGLNGSTAMSAAMSNWSGAGAGVNYAVGTSNPSATGGLSVPDRINAILFNDPCGIVPSGVAALGGFSAVSGTYKISPDTVTTYETPTEVDVVVGKNFSTNQATFNGLMTHEVGHTLGFRHSDKTADDSGPCVLPSPCTSNAIMNSSIAFNLQTLQQWDLDAVRIVYGNQTGNRPDYLFPGNPRWPTPSVTFDFCYGATITTQPSGATIVSGSQTTLTVAATGTNPTYQWYIDNSPGAATLVAGGTSSSLNVSPSTTTKYFVQVRACPSSCIQPVNSNVVTVTVTGCTPPTVPAPTAAPSSIASGQSSTLTANAAGSGPFTYQWFVGNSGNTTSPINGQTNSSVTVSPTTTTSYWVRVTGQCAPLADSPATTVTVGACVPPSAPAPNASPSTISSGQSSTLSVSPTGTSPFTYQWFVGNSGDQSNPIIGATNSSTSVSPTATT